MIVYELDIPTLILQGIQFSDMKTFREVNELSSTSTSFDLMMIEMLIHLNNSLEAGARDFQ